MIGSFVLFVEGVTVVGKSINLVDDLNDITTVFDFSLECEHVIFRIFVEGGEDRIYSINFRTMRINVLNISEVWIGS